MRRKKKPIAPIAAGGAVATAVLLAILFGAPFKVDGTCQSNHDGDTISVQPAGSQDVFTCRLAGIDAPELDQPWGPEAQAEVQRLTKGRKVSLTVEGKDRYGRLIVEVETAEGISLNRRLVQSGLARWYAAYPGRDEQLPALEREAKAAGRGLWADDKAIAPWDWRKGVRHGNAPNRRSGASGRDHRAAGNRLSAWNRLVRARLAPHHPIPRRC